MGFHNFAAIKNGGEKPTISLTILLGFLRRFSIKPRMLFSRNIAFVMIMMLGLITMPLAYHYSKGNLSFKLPPPRVKTDAVMVFTGSPDRLVQGYESYLQGQTKKVMITGDDYPEEAREPEVRKLSKKVRKKNVYIDLKATNTIENAQNGAQWALDNRINSILLVTAEGHMPRAYFELRRLLPKNIKVYADPVPGDQKYQGMDSEEIRLLCRMYETATDTSFCYKMRTIAHHMGL